MQFIMLTKMLANAERVLPDLIADWMNTMSVQNINISFVLKLHENKLICWVIKLLEF